MQLVKNDEVEIYAEKDNVFLKVFRGNVTLAAFNKVCSEHPRIKVTKFGNIKLALETIKSAATLIGSLKPAYEIEISSDGLVAHLKINYTDEEYKNKEDTLVNEIMTELSNNGISEGIQKDIFNGKIPMRQSFAIAEGITPVNGLDAVVKYFEFSEKKPQITKDGKVDHYELQLIDNVNKGDWVGEKIPPTAGRAGKSVTGEVIEPRMGRDFNLKYDDGSVEIFEENGLDVARAKIDGAVKFKAGKICIDNHLIIDGDVEYETGNIMFDGYVTITGTVKDLFSVTATKDIVISSPYGVGAIKKIESTEGSVCIKGGINGKGEAQITAFENVYLKYANEAFIDAGNLVHIGLYSMDCVINAKKIVLPPNTGRIIGGNISADYQVVTGSIGNKSERKTKVSVKGFERVEKKLELDTVKISLREIVVKANKLKRQLEIFESNKSKLDERAMNTYRGLIQEYERLVEELNRINSKIQYLEEVLRTKGEGEVQVHNAAFPKTFMEIKNLQKRVTDLITGSFYVKDKMLHHD